MANRRPPKKSSKKPLILFCIGLAILVVVGVVYLNHRSNKNSPEQAQSPSKAPTAQSTFKGGSNRQPSSNGVTQGGAIDTKGAGATTTPNQGTPVSSTSGLITLNQPSANAALSNGSVVAGAAQVSTVQYRLVDNQAGVIAQGQLSVVNGKFSGNLQFKSVSNSGTLELFSFDPQTGAEVNSVRIAVSFE